MLDVARTMPGFRDFNQYTAPDGERMSVIVFDTLEAQRAWRDHPEHRVAQDRGRSSFYCWYRIQVCELLDERSFDG